MKKLTAAVLAIAAVSIATEGSTGSADSYSAVRAEVVAAGEGAALDVAKIRVLDALSPGGSYRLPAVGIVNIRRSRIAYRLVVARVPRAPRRPSRAWLRFVPASVVVDAGQSRPVGVRLDLPDNAQPGAYEVVLGLRPVGSNGARLAFRIAPVESTRTWLAPWVVPALIGALLVVSLVRGQQPSRRP